MANRISVAKIGKAMARFEKTVEYINQKVDGRSRNGKQSEENDVAIRHYSGTADDGSRCWSF